MSLIEEVSSYKSVAVVGMEKNTGKTECMNYVLRGCSRIGHPVGVTSIGIDGESCDQVTRTAKPEITLAAGTFFSTSEKFYHARRLISDIQGLTEWQTALGRLVTARAITTGKVILSGPVTTGLLRATISEMQRLGARTVLVDGALSRKSLASPAITDAMILATGAALSTNLQELVRQTRFVYDLLHLPVADLSCAAQLASIEQGIWAISEDDTPVDLEIPSALLLQQQKERLYQYGGRLFVSGAVSDKLLDTLRMQPEIFHTELIIKDFTRVFATPQAVRAYLQKGGRMTVLRQPKLLAISINPWSPSGYTLHSDKLREALTEVVSVPVVDVRQQAAETE